jgi:flagella basal body P-ring formation protein FlgA
MLLRSFGIAVASVLAAVPFASAGDRAPELGALRVELLRKVELPAGGSLRLDQIAELDGEGAAEAAGLELGRVPGPGRQRAVSRLTVKRALELGGFARGSFVLDGASQVRVIGEGVPLQREDVRAAIEQALRRIAPEADVAVERVQLPRGVQLPAGEHRLRVSRSFTSPRQGPNRIPLEIVSDSGVRRVGLYARLKIEGPLVVAAREMRRGQRVSAKDVTVERRTYPAGRELFHEEDEVVGLVARSTLRAGEPIRGTALGPKDAVVSGQTVEAVYHRGGVELVLQTKARGSGGVGAIIPVTGQDGASILDARVVNNGRVRILGSEESP